MSLPTEKILELLSVKEPYSAQQEPNSKNGPLKYSDKEYRCTSRGCSSPTHYKVSGIAYCVTHALNKLNDVVINLKETSRQYFAPEERE